MRRIDRRSILLSVLLIALILLSGHVIRAYEALLLAGELGGYTPLNVLQSRAGVTVRPLCISRESRHYSADIYLPEDSPEAGIVLLHGAEQAGKDDPRLANFARVLAGHRFAVLVPELPGPKQLRIRAEDTQGAVDAFHVLNHYPGLEKRVGIGGISVSAGLAILAALNPETRDEVAFIISVGGYHSLPRTLDYAITGEFQLEGTWQHQTPNAYGKWLFVLSNLELLDKPADRRTLRDIAYRRMVSPHADISDLAIELSKEGQSVLAYVTATNQTDLGKRYAALPVAIRKHIEDLDLSNKKLGLLRAPLLLIHGYEDTIIPYTESISLARALPRKQVKLFLVHGLEHVDSHLTRLTDVWHLWQASYALLYQRDHPAR